MRLSPVQSNFTAGELSPLTRGRVDVARYHNGAKTIQNAVIIPQGGALRRSGTRFVGEVKNSGNFTRLIPFEFSEAQSYVLEFGQQYIRFYKNGIQIAGMSGPVEVATPYSSTDLLTIKYAQSADTLYLVHNNYPPQKLQRTSDISWTLTQINFIDGPYLSTNTDSTKTITASATTGAISLTANFAAFTPTDIGRLVRFENSGTAGYVTITAFTDSSHVNATVATLFPLPSATATVGWRLGAWSNTTGFPGTVCFFEQRLVFSDTTNQPQVIWFSNVNDFENFAPTDTTLKVLDSSAINYGIASLKLNQIQWLDPAAVLLIGTVGAEWIAEEANTTQSLSPTNIQIVFQTSNGSNSVTPKRVNSSLVFVSKSGKKVKELVYQFAINSYTSTDISVFSEHLLNVPGGVVDMAYQQEPYGILWFVRADGLLLGLTFLKEQEVFGWHQHVIGGNFQGGNSVVESICCISKPDVSADQLWMIVKRTINGVQKRYIEFLEDYFTPQSPTDESKMYFMDSCLTYNGPPKTNFQAPHLPNSTIAVVADGAVPDAAIANPIVTDGSGNFTIPTASGNVTAGLPYTTVIQTLEPAFEYLTINNQGKFNKIDQVVMRLINTLGVKTGISLTNLQVLQLAPTFRQMDVVPPLFSGDKKVYTGQRPSYDQSIFIVQDQPYPLCLLAMIYHLVYYDSGK